MLLAACGAPCDEDYVVLGGDPSHEALVADVIGSFQEQVALNFCVDSVVFRPATWSGFRDERFAGLYHNVQNRITIMESNPGHMARVLRHELCHAVADEHPALLHEPALDRVPVPDVPRVTISQTTRRSEAFAQLCELSVVPLHVLVRWEASCGLDTLSDAARHVLDHAYRDRTYGTSPIRLGDERQLVGPPGARWSLPPTHLRRDEYALFYDVDGQSDYQSVSLTVPSDGLVGVRTDPSDRFVDVLLPPDADGTTRPFGSVLVGSVPDPSDNRVGALLHDDDAPTHVDTPCLRGSLYLLAAEGLWLFEADGPTLRWWPLLAPG